MTRLLVSAIILDMLGDAQSQPVRLLVNYWELPPASIGNYLDDLLRRDVKALTSYVPWHLFETDISHSLHRFLLAASDRGFKVSLILTPEVGIQYQFSGLPKDLLGDKTALARDSESHPFYQNLPPRVFSLPSLSSTEFAKRYYSFLARFSGFISDLGRVHHCALERFEIILTGSFWKYYRSARDSSLSVFGGIAGDFSKSLVLQYRKNMDLRYSREEFNDTYSGNANRWKAKSMELTNQRHFFQETEDVFRSRCVEILSRNPCAVRVLPVELFTPDADPGFLYSNFLQLISVGNGDFSKFSQLIDMYATRGAQVSTKRCEPFVHWTALGAFRSLSESEKQFLILKSLLLMGGRGGGILIDDQQWFALSSSFRARVESLAGLFAHKKLALRSRALYLAPHSWSRAGPLWDELYTTLGPNAQFISSLDYLNQDTEAGLAIVDPSFIITRNVLRNLLAWCQPGKILALPRTALYTDAARKELENEVSLSKGTFEIDLGIPYTVAKAGYGKLIVFDPVDGRNAEGEITNSWKKFLTSVLSIADIEGICRLNDSKLKTISLVRHAGNGSGIGLFILNDLSQKVSTELNFDEEVTVSDFGSSFLPDAKKASEPAAEPGKQFFLEVPPCGVLPVALEGIEMKDHERRDALQIAELTKQSADEAALGSLPGLEQMGSPEWN